MEMMKEHCGWEIVFNSNGFRMFKSRSCREEMGIEGPRLRSDGFV